MAEFDFSKVDDYVQANNGGLSFFKLADHNCQAKIRFMYGPGESFKCFSVHKIKNSQNKDKFVSCLREPGQSLDTCPLCKANYANMAQFFIPVYVLSVTECVNGQMQPEKTVNQVMIFQRGKTFAATIESAIRQSQGTPLVNNVFNLVRFGKTGSTDTTYSVEFISRDQTSLQDLPERPNVLGSSMLLNWDYQDMLQYVSTGTFPNTQRNITTQQDVQQAPSRRPF